MGGAQRNPEGFETRHSEHMFARLKSCEPRERFTFGLRVLGLPVGKLGCPLLKDVGICGSPHHPGHPVPCSWF